ncbi:unnamed protein product [Chrysoparadoxa australica]
MGLAWMVYIKVLLSSWLCALAYGFEIGPLALARQTGYGHVPPRIRSVPLRACTLDLEPNQLVLIEDREDLEACIPLFKSCAMMGIDTETQPTFSKGSKPKPTSLLQVALRKKDGSEYVFLFDLLALLGQWKAFALLDKCLQGPFCSKKVIIVGQAIERDLLELHRSYPKCQTFKKMSCLVEVNALHRQLFPEVSDMVGLRKLALLHLEERMSKKQQVSNWARRPLSEAQLNYAGSDVTVLMRLYDHMVKQISGKRKKFEVGSVFEDLDTMLLLEQARVRREQKERRREAAAAAGAPTKAVQSVRSNREVGAGRGRSLGRRKQKLPLGGDRSRKGSRAAVESSKLRYGKRREVVGRGHLKKGSGAAVESSKLCSGNGKRREAVVEPGRMRYRRREETGRSRQMGQGAAAEPGHRRNRSPSKNSEQLQPYQWKEEPVALVAGSHGNHRVGRTAKVAGEAVAAVTGTNGRR